MTIHAALAILAGLLAATPLPAAEPSEAGRDWLRSAARPLAAPEPTRAELQPLVDRLAGARVIGIGEATHGTHEDQAFKAALIRELVRTGAADVLALEANRAAGLAFDRYVRLGEGDPAALVRSPSFFRIWKGDEFAGLLVWLRAWNLDNPGRPVRVIGIDNQDAGTDAAAALAFLAPRDPALAKRLRAELGTLLPGPDGRRVDPFVWIQKSRPGEMPRAMAATAALRDTLARGRSGTEPGGADAAHAAEIAWQNLHEFEREVGVVDMATLPLDYMSRRDRYMARNLAALLRPGERAAFWAHDMHVTDAVPAFYADGGYTSVGAELERTLGTGYRTVGFTYTRATVLTRRVAGSAIDYSRRQEDEPVALANDRPQDLGSAFAALPANAAWLDVAAARPAPAARAFLAAEMWRGWAGSVVDPAKFQPESEMDRPMPNGMGFDLLVWFRTLTPQHRWPVAPPAATPWRLRG